MIRLDVPIANVLVCQFRCDSMQEQQVCFIRINARHEIESLHHRIIVPSELRLRFRSLHAILVEAHGNDQFVRAR